MSVLSHHSKEAKKYVPYKNAEEILDHLSAFTMSLPNHKKLDSLFSESICCSSSNFPLNWHGEHPSRRKAQRMSECWMTGSPVRLMHLREKCGGSTYSCPKSPKSEGQCHWLFAAESPGHSLRYKSAAQLSLTFIDLRPSLCCSISQAKAVQEWKLPAKVLTSITWSLWEHKGSSFGIISEINRQVICWRDILICNWKGDCLGCCDPLGWNPQESPAQPPAQNKATSHIRPGWPGLHPFCFGNFQGWILVIKLIRVSTTSFLKVSNEPENKN